MTTQSSTYPVRRSPLGAFLLIILLMLVSYAAIQVIPGSHAATAHRTRPFAGLSKAKASAAAHGKTHQPVPLSCFRHNPRLVF